MEDISFSHVPNSSEEVETESDNSHLPVLLLILFVLLVSFVSIGLGYYFSHRPVSVYTESTTPSAFPTPLDIPPINHTTTY